MKLKESLYYNYLPNMKIPQSNHEYREREQKRLFKETP